MERVMKVLPLFIVLLLFSAAIIFSYIGWVAFKGREGHFSLQKFKAPSTSFANRPLIGEGDQTFENLNEKKLHNLHDPENEGLPPGLVSVNEDALRDPDMDKRIELLKMRVISKLRRHILDGAKLKGHINDYSVNFSAVKYPPKKRINRKDVLCKLKGVRFKFVDQNSSPLFNGKKFPNEPLFGVRTQSDASDNFVSEVTPDPIYNNCAVIPSSAAFDGARHGIDIDSHDFIMRFNNAPTTGYEDDVGSLTSMRIVNSQVVTKPHFKFPSSVYHEGPTKDTTSDSLWESTRKYLIWDPCSYTSSINQWFRKPDFPVFEKYFNMTSKSQRERNRYYLLDCRVLWRLWEVLQEHSFTKIHGTPPTSGFIGIALSLQICNRVNVFEYIPSIRESNRCHYYSPKNDSNPSCTYGSWHPVSAEKLFYLGLSDGRDKQIFMDGILTLPGVSNFQC